MIFLSWQKFKMHKYTYFFNISGDYRSIKKKNGIGNDTKLFLNQLQNIVKFF